MTGVVDALDRPLRRKRIAPDVEPEIDLVAAALPTLIDYAAGANGRLHRAQEKLGCVLEHSLWRKEQRLIDSSAAAGRAVRKICGDIGRHHRLKRHRPGTAGCEFDRLIAPLRSDLGIDGHAAVGGSHEPLEEGVVHRVHPSTRFRTSAIEWLDSSIAASGVRPPRSRLRARSHMP